MAATIDCTLATCEVVPTLDPDDRLLVRELRERGLTVSVEVWNDHDVDWGAARLCLVRSTWDYHNNYASFMRWIDELATVTTVRNDPDLLRWNSHKSYLLDLERRGVSIVPTTLVPHGESRRVAELCEERGWDEVVLKPALGAASQQVMHVRRGNGALAAGQAHLDGLVQTQDVLVQPYLEAVTTYLERGLMFFNGRYSHAVAKKKPFDTVLAITDAHSALVEATLDEIQVAAQAVRALPRLPLYARVDLLHDDNGPCVSELELIEPALYLGAYAPARTAFADAVERELTLGILYQ